MGVELVETADSREFTIDSVRSNGEWKFIARATGEADPENAVYLAVSAAAPFFWNGLSRQTMTATPKGGGVYIVSVPYKIEIFNTAAQDPTQSPGSTDGPGGGSPSGTPSGPTSDDDKVEANVTLEIGGRPPKVWTSLATLLRFTHGGGGGGDPQGSLLAPDHRRSINVGQDGKVEGYEIDDPASNIVFDYTFDWCTWRYVRRLHEMVWTTNNNTTWRRYNRRELAFLGATLRTSRDARNTISFRFGVRIQRTIAIGDIRDDGVGGSKMPAAAITVRGMDYLWVLYETVTDVAAKRKTTRPKYGYVEQVLKEADFTAFGIGG